MSNPSSTTLKHTPLLTNPHSCPGTSPTKKCQLFLSYLDCVGSKSGAGHVSGAQWVVGVGGVEVGEGEVAGLQELEDGVAVAYFDGCFEDRLFLFLSGRLRGTGLEEVSSCLS
jgi:hypothetical protein